MFARLKITYITESITEIIVINLMCILFIGIPHIFFIQVKP